jgi:hypothetical protein
MDLANFLGSRTHNPGRGRTRFWAGPEPFHHTNSLALQLTRVTGSRDRARRLPPGRCGFLSWVAQNVTSGMGLKRSAWFAETECENAFSLRALSLIFLWACRSRLFLYLPTGCCALTVHILTVYIRPKMWLGG